MTAEPDSDPDVQDATTSARYALRAVCLALPHLSGLAHEVQLRADARCGTAGIFASGRLVFNPEWWLQLTPPEAMFVMAHELLHLALDSHGRTGDEDPWLVNVAHDYIINDILERELGEPPPAGGLHAPGASNHSLEWWVGQLRAGRDDGLPLPERPFRLVRKNLPDPGRLSGLGAALDQALAPPSLPDLHGGIGVVEGDVLSEDREREWYPDETPGSLIRRHKIIQASAAKSACLGATWERLNQVWNLHHIYSQDSSNSQACFEAVKTAYRAPWERALQRWFDGTGESLRSYSRASRRGADRDDGIVLAGRKREGRTLHVILDTSGSMLDLLPRLLGIMAAFAEANHVDEIHLIQEGGGPPTEEWLPTSSLGAVELSGFGGSSVVAALDILAADPHVEAAVIITDGDIYYPAKAPPLQVLWALPWANPGFQPGYGSIITLDALISSGDS